MKGYVRRRNTTSKITDVEKLVHEAIDNIKPEDWKKCVDHVKKQEDYFREMDAKFEKYQNDDSLENVQFGQLDEVLATDVAAFQLQNPSMYSTVWKFHDFSISQILREIKFGDSRSAKSANYTHI